MMARCIQNTSSSLLHHDRQYPPALVRASPAAAPLSAGPAPLKASLPRVMAPRKGDQSTRLNARAIREVLRGPSEPKTIYLIRHAQGFHNVGWENLDAHLTETGWQQVEALGRYIKSLGPRMQLDVVFASPLVRTLETASGAFGRTTRPNAGLLSSLMGPPLMNPTRASLHECTTQSAIRGALTGVRIVACEKCREEMANPPDKFQHLSLTKKQFPGIDFSTMKEKPEDDVYEAWHKDAGSHGEPFEHVVERARDFGAYLLSRPEKYIGVVAHVNFNRAFHTALYGPGMAEYREFENCELRSLTLSRGPDNVPILTPGPEGSPAFAGGEISIGWADPLQPAFATTFNPPSPNLTLAA